VAREITIMTPEQVELKFELAGIGSRAIAMIVDTLILIAANIALVIALIAGGFLSFDVGFKGAPWWIPAIAVFIFFAVNGGYFLYFEATRNGQTPGKKSAGIRVIRDTGHPLDFRGALLRNVMRIVDVLPSAYGVAIISVFLSPEYRRLGDYVGGTLVVKVGREEEVIRQRSLAPPAANATDPGTADVSFIPPGSMPYISTIGKDDYRAIRHFLDRRRQLDPIVARNLAHKLAEPVAGKLRMDMSSVGDPIGFLEAVSAEWERRVIH